MKQQVTERVNFFLSSRGIKKVELAEKLGWKPAKLISQLNGTRGISLNLLCALYELYPEINLDYIFTGNGNIYAEKDKTDNALLKEVQELRIKIREKDAQIQVLKSLIK